MSDPVPASPVGPPPTWQRVVAATLRAAYAWSVRHHEPKARREVARMTGVVMAAHSPGHGPATPRELADALHKPLGELPALAGCPDAEIADVVLLADDRLTPQAYDLACEYAAPLGAAIDQGTWMPTWTRMHSEQIRQATYAVMVESGRQDVYVTSRRFLIEHPAGTSAELSDWVSRTGAVLPPNGYKPLPSDQIYYVRDKPGWWFPCPTCRWPMAVTGGHVRCRYRPHAASYRVRPGVKPTDLPKLSRIEPGPVIATPKAMPAADAQCVDAGIWRFVVVPGAAELRLFRALEKLGASVELWPDLDAYDLLVRAGTAEHHVDLKEYQSIRRLVDHLTAAPPAAEILLPTTHEYQLGTLRSALPKSVRITTERLFLKRIRRLLKENG